MAPNGEQKMATTTEAEQPLMTVREVASRLRLSTQTIYAWVETGRLPALRLNGLQIRVRQTDVEKLLR
jgi:excisionase family DNA binding protein